MNLKIFNSLLKKESKTFEPLFFTSDLAKKLKSLCKQNNYLVFDNLTIYHHDDHIFIPFLILDPLRGIYIFEDKNWSFSELNNCKIEKHKNTKKTENSLSYENTASFIQKKLSEVINDYSIKIFKFLITQNLSFTDYLQLDDEKKILLPKEKIIFNDTTEEIILKKLKSAKKEDLNIPNSENLMASLLTQFLIYEENKPVKLANEEQQRFILNRNYNTENIEGLSLSGKTTSLILKAILLKLENKNRSVTIIKPTVLSCDMVKIKLMNTVEYSIINVDLTSIKVITPQEFEESRFISEYILCDDSYLLDKDFIKYLLSFQNRSKISFVNLKQNTDVNFKFTKNFQNKNLEITFYNTLVQRKIIDLLNNYIKQNSPKKILVISKNLSLDLQKNFKQKAVIIDSSKKILDQSQSYIFLSDFDNINDQRADIIILTDLDKLPQEKIAYAINLANQKVYILFESECENIKILKKIFNNKKGKK